MDTWNSEAPLTHGTILKCFSNLKSLNLVRGSSHLPRVPELLTNVFIRLFTLSFHLHCHVSHKLLTGFWLLFTIPCPSFCTMAPHSSQGWDCSNWPYRIWMTSSQRNVSFGQPLVCCYCQSNNSAFFYLSVCSNYSLCLELSAFPHPTHPWPHLISPYDCLVQPIRGTERGGRAEEGEAGVFLSSTSTSTSGGISCHISPPQFQLLVYDLTSDHHLLPCAVTAFCGCSSPGFLFVSFLFILLYQCCNKFL